jgi:hypothetical protein
MCLILAILAPFTRFRLGVCVSPPASGVDPERLTLNGLRQPAYPP